MGVAGYQAFRWFRPGSFPPFIESKNHDLLPVPFDLVPGGWHRAGRQRPLLSCGSWSGAATQQREISWNRPHSGSHGEFLFPRTPRTVHALGWQRHSLSESGESPYSEHSDSTLSRSILSPSLPDAAAAPPRAASPPRAAASFGAAPQEYRAAISRRAPAADHRKAATPTARPLTASAFCGRSQKLTSRASSDGNTKQRSNAICKIQSHRRDVIAAGQGCRPSGDSGGDQ